MDGGSSSSFELQQNSFEMFSSKSHAELPMLPSMKPSYQGKHDSWVMKESKKKTTLAEVSQLIVR